MKCLTSTFMLCVIILCLVVSPLAYAEKGGAEAELLHTQTLHFSKPPVSIDSIVAMPDERIAVTYYAAGTAKTKEEYRLDLFSANGTPMLSKSFCQIKPGDDPLPHAQIILQSDRFLCEFYPDITSMEVCYRTAYSYAGHAVSKEKKITLKYGEACYTECVSDYMILKQAHAFDEPDASLYRAVEIIHIPTGQHISLSLYDWSSFCAFAGSHGDLLIAQKNERGNLEIRRYAADAGMQESVTEFGAEYFYGNQFASIQSAVCIGNLAYLQVRLSNEEAAILTYDIEKGLITASSTLHAAQGSDCIASIQSSGSVLLAVDGHWHGARQRYMLTVDVLDADMRRTPVIREQILFMLPSDASGKLTTIEVDEEASSFAVCHYRLSAATEIPRSKPD